MSNYTKNFVLSKNVLHLRFMKETREEMCRQHQQQESKVFFHQFMSEKGKKPRSKFDIEHSWSVCAGVTQFRRSFLGANKKLEKLMEKRNENRKTSTDQEEENEKFQLIVSQYQQKHKQNVREYHRKQQQNNRHNGFKNKNKSQKARRHFGSRKPRKTGEK